LKSRLSSLSAFICSINLDDNDLYNTYFFQ